MQTILITGTSNGIGKYLAEYYTSKGHQVIGCSRNPADFNFENYKHFCIDITKEKDVKLMFDQIKTVYGHLDVLINNAGVYAYNYVMLTTIENAQEIMNTNFIGVFICCRDAIKLMQKKRNGRIVNLSSIAVPMAKQGTAFYSASKAAVEQFSKVLSKEIASYGITVNSLELTFVKESGMAKQVNEKALQETLDYSISKTCISFEDISNAIDFLILPQSNMITGHILPVGGF